MLLYYFATFLVAVIGGFVQLCLCFTAWRSLNVRWSLLKSSCAMAAHNLSWATLGAACAAGGGVLAWFFGYTYLRAPLDDYCFDQMIHNDAHHGRIQGPRALFPVYHRGHTQRGWR